MQANELIQQFCDKTGIAYVENVSGSLSVDCDGLTVSIRSLDEGRRIAVSGEVFYTAPGDDCEALYRAMFEAQHLYSGTVGAVFSINPDTGALTLFRIIDCETLEIDAFLEMLGQFITVLELWSRVVASFDPAESPASDGGQIHLHGQAGVIPV